MSEENNQDQQPARPTDTNQKSTSGVKPKGAGPQAARPQAARPQAEKPPQVSATVTRFAPLYIAKNEKPNFVCVICRNDLDEVCNICKSQDITDTAQCMVVKLKCGHMFHRHCLELFPNNRVCPYPGCNKVLELA